MDVAILLAILAFALASFLFQWLAVDVTALTVLALLLVTGLVTPTEAIAGFSNEAVVTVLLLFILSDSLARSGVVSRLGHRLARMSGRSHTRAAVTLLLAASLLSGFINNTATVAIFLPVAILLAKHYQLSPSRLLMPLSFASILGGMCTLIGTSTNLLVASLAVGRGLEPFGVFDFAPVGLALLVLGTGYNLLLMKTLPERASLSDLTGKYQLSAYLTEVRVPEGSPLAGRTVVQEAIADRFRLTVLEILRDPRKISDDLDRTPINEEDVLLVRGAMEDIVAFQQHFGLLLLSDVKLSDADLADDRSILMEVQVTPTSDLAGRTLRELDFRRRFGVFVLAIHRPGELVRDKVAFIPLTAADTLLVFGPRERIDALAAGGDLLPLQEMDVHLRLRRRWWLSTAVIPAVIVLAATGLVPILTGALAGVVLLLLARVHTIQEAYKAIDWTVIFLLAAILPLGTAIEKSGLADLVGGSLAGLGVSYGPWAVLALVLLGTTLLTEMISNNSAAVLMVPIAFSVATRLGVDPKPFLLAVAYGASMSFVTPIGYQTNTMVFGPGGYRFTDYTRAGIPLTLAFWVVAALLIPIFFPF